MKPFSSIALSRVRGLHPVAAGLAVVDDDAVGDRVVDAGDHQAHAEAVDPVVAGLHDLGEVQAGVDLQDREGDLRRVERLLREAEHDDRVLAAGEHQDRLLELGGDLTEDVDRLRLELVELTQLVVGVGVGHDVARTSLGTAATIVATAARLGEFASPGVVGQTRRNEPKPPTRAPSALVPARARRAAGSGPRGRRLLVGAGAGRPADVRHGRRGAGARAAPARRRPARTSSPPTRPRGSWTRPWPTSTRARPSPWSPRPATARGRPSRRPRPTGRAASR